MIFCCALSNRKQLQLCMQLHTHSSKPTLRFLLIFVFAGLLPTRAFAGSPIDFEIIENQIIEEKGSAATASKWMVSLDSPHILNWSVETSDAEEFDFARLTIPFEATADQNSVAVLSGDVDLAPDHFLNVEFVTEEGILLHAAIKNPNPGENDYHLPMESFSASGDEKPTFPAVFVAVRIMVSGDQSPLSGTNQVRIKNIALE